MLTDLLKPDRPAAQLAPGVFILNLSEIAGGVESVLDRIPSGTSAVYAWFRKFEVPESANGDEYFEALRSILTTQHSTPRTARLAPAHRVTVSADQRLSEAKSAALRVYSQSTAFRDLIGTVFGLSLLFQQPLYVGKAIDLKGRVAQHLGFDSPLRKRLSDAGIDMDSCRLVYISLPDASALLQLSSLGEKPTDESAEDILPIELAVEEILSRIFLPLFTVRFG